MTNPRFQTSNLKYINEDGGSVKNEARVNFIEAMKLYCRQCRAYKA